MQGVIHAGFMYHACITLCHTSDWDFSNIYMIFLLSMYLNYKGLVWYGSEHPGVPFSDIRVWGVVTSGCRKPEDGHVSEHFCLLSTLFVLVFCKKGPYVDEITCSQIHIDTLPATFRTIPVPRFNWYKCDTGVIHESGMYHSLYIMLINTYKAKRDRVIENPAKP